MAKRRKFLAGLGALVSGSAAAMGTGAFSQATADRTVSVSVAGDGAAYLDLNPVSEYASISNGGELTLNFGTLNQDSDFRFYDVFQVSNTTDEPLAIFLDTGSGYGWSNTQEQNLEGTIYDNLADQGVNQNGWYDDPTNADPEEIGGINGPESAPSAYNQAIASNNNRTWSTSNDHIIDTGESLEPDWYIFDTPDDGLNVSGMMRIIAYTRGFVEAGKSLAEL